MVSESKSIRASLLCISTRCPEGSPEGCVAARHRRGRRVRAESQWRLVGIILLQHAGEAVNRAQRSARTEYEKDSNSRFADSPFPGILIRPWKAENLRIGAGLRP